MAIATLQDYTQAVRYRLIQHCQGIAAQDLWQSSRARTTIPVAAGNFILAVAANGAVPTDSLSGAPPIFDFSGAGYLTGCEFGSDRISPNGGAGNGYTLALLHDRLFHCGTYSGAASTQVLSAQPSYASRLPGGSYAGTQLWIEGGATAPGSALVTVTYTNQAGTTGKSTSITFPNTSQTGLSLQMPLASGDTGVQVVESVTWGAATSFNIVVIRPLYLVNFAGNLLGLPNASTRRGIGQAHMHTIYNDSCIGSLIRGNSSSQSEIELELELAA